MNIITKECFYCGKTGLLELPADPEQVQRIAEGLEAYRQGQFIQMALPMLTAEQREQIMTGVHPLCWAQMGLDDEHEDERGIQEDFYWFAMDDKDDAQ